jgi:hypothetical protein
MILLMFARKIPVLLSIPLVVMMATFGLFQVLRDSYTAEARLRVAPLVMTDSIMATRILPLGDSTLPMPDLYPEVLRTMASDTVLTLLSYHMAINRLSKPSPFADESPWNRVDHPIWRTDMTQVFQQCLHRLRTPLDSSVEADSLRQLISALGVSPDQLRERLVIRGIPGTNHIRLQAVDESPEQSMFLVNRLGNTFVRYWTETKQVEIERQVNALMLAGKQCRTQLQAAELRLKAARARLYSGTGEDDLMRLQERIYTLEKAQGLAIARVARLESALDHKRARQSPASVVRVRQAPPIKGPREPLQQELRAAMTQLGLIEQELLILRRKLADTDSTEMAPLLANVAAAQLAIDANQRQLEIQQHALAQVGELLTFTPANRSRVPSPLTSYSLTGMAGFASLLLWLLILLQIGYIKWAEPLI